MPGSSKNTSGKGNLYHLLIHEVSQYNKELPAERKLSIKDRYDFISQKIYPRFKDIPKYKRKITVIRKAIINGIRRWPRQNTSGKGNLYHLLVHEVSQYNKELPAEKKLSMRDRYDFISKKIFPRFKDVAKRKLRITDIRKAIVNGIHRLPRQPTCDVNTIPEDRYTGVDYYDIEKLLKEELPQCINVKVSAGNFGETDIFNTRDFDYNKSGVADITNAINTFTRKLATRKKSGYGSGEIYYNGFPQLIPGKKNDGNPDNYYLELVLNKGATASKQIEVVKLPEPIKKKAKKKKKSIAKQLDEQIRKVEFQKSKTKRLQREIIKQIDFFQALLKQPYIPKKDKMKYAKEAFKREKARIDRPHKKGEITDKKYNQLLNMITKAFNQ